ncbi:AMP-binding protein [Aureibaculum conchae]|uniref:AMP-binding protein n=1 Tax=Aureibaculum sp. 2308TA14-22 TaxID=3108392 RepID=UPI0033922145
MNTNNFNKNFKLNGNSFVSEQELIDYSKTTSSSIYSFLEVWFSKELTIDVQTSGSTGRPKIIKLRKEYMINSAKATGTFFILPEKTTALLCLSVGYIAGKMMLVRALTLGWHLDIVEVSSNPLFSIDKDYDFCAMVPMQVQNSLEKLHKIKKLIIGGGAVDKSLLKKIQSEKTEIFATYGMTETITHIAVKPLNSFRHAELVSVPHYKTLPNIQISTDSRGCLIINAPNISDEKVITNDLVKIISDTEFEWLGRVDNVINSAGVKLITEQIEEKLSKIIDSRFFVAGIPDELLGEKLVLIIEGDNKTEYLKTQILSLPFIKKFEIPREVYTVEKFIDTDTKKINRRATLKSMKF